jgi:hypothetical protein
MAPNTPTRPCSIFTLNRHPFRQKRSPTHEENGLVERAHREILYHLRSILAEKRTRDEWSDACPM